MENFARNIASGAVHFTGNRDPTETHTGPIYQIPLNRYHTISTTELHTVITFMI